MAPDSNLRALRFFVVSRLRETKRASLVGDVLFQAFQRCTATYQKSYGCDTEAAHSCKASSWALFSRNRA